VDNSCCNFFFCYLIYLSKCRNVFFFTHLRNRLHRRKQPKPVPSSIQFCESSCKRWTQRQRSRQWKLLSHDEDHRLRKRPLYNSWFSIWRIFATTSIWLKNKIKAGLCLDWERVRTSKIKSLCRKSKKEHWKSKKNNKNQNVESLFLNWSERQKWRAWSERQKSEPQK
jgi:hypothetical protein